MTVLAPTRAALASRQPASRAVTALPIVIERPRGGVFQDRAPRASAQSKQAAAPSAREAVLAAIWPLLRESAGPAPNAATATICDAAVAAIRTRIARAVVSVRIRLGNLARDLDGADRIAIEDVALTLKVDEAELLDRMVGLLSPQELVGAATPGRTTTSDTVDRTIASRVELHMLELIRAEPRLTETARARLLFCLPEARA